MVEWIMNN